MFVSWIFRNVKKCLRFCPPNRNTPQKILIILQKSVVEDTLTRVFKMCKIFKENKELIQDEPRSGKSSKPNDQEYTLREYNIFPYSLNLFKFFIKIIFSLTFRVV